MIPEICDDRLHGRLGARPDPHGVADHPQHDLPDPHRADGGRSSITREVLNQHLRQDAAEASSEGLLVYSEEQNVPADVIGDARGRGDRGRRDPHAHRLRHGGPRLAARPSARSVTGAPGSA